MEQAQIVGGTSIMGRSTDLVRCACGHVNRFYRWSWAGHGKARCKGCGRWIMWYGLWIRTANQSGLD